MPTLTDQAGGLERPAKIDDDAYLGIREQIRVARAADLAAHRKARAAVTKVLDRDSAARAKVLGGDAVVQRLTAQRQKAIRARSEATVQALLSKAAAPTHVGLAKPKIAVDLDKLQKVSAKTMDDLRGVTMQALRYGVGSWKSPREADLVLKSRAFAERDRPFDGWGKYYSWSTEDSNAPTIVQFANSTNGQIGSILLASDFNTGDDSVVSAESRTSVGFFYTVPKDGLLEIWAELESRASSQTFLNYDEFGFSLAFIGHSQRVALTVYQPYRQDTGIVGTFSYFGDASEKKYVKTYYSAGQVLWATWTSPAVKAGDTVYVEVSSYEQLYQGSNDSSFFDQLFFQWLARRVFVRVK